MPWQHLVNTFHKNQIKIRKSPNLLLGKPKAVSQEAIPEQPWQEIRKVPALHWLLVQTRSMLIKKIWCFWGFPFFLVTIMAAWNVSFLSGLLELWERLCSSSGHIAEQVFAISWELRNLNWDCIFGLSVQMALYTYLWVLAPGSKGLLIWSP